VILVPLKGYQKHIQNPIFLVVVVVVVVGEASMNGT
jgi:hypothetical protein